MRIATAPGKPTRDYKPQKREQTDDLTIVRLLDSSTGMNGLLLFPLVIEPDLRRRDATQHRGDVLRRLDFRGSCRAGAASLGSGRFLCRFSRASSWFLFTLRFPRCFLRALLRALRRLSLGGALCHFARRLLGRLLCSLSLGSHRALL